MKRWLWLLVSVLMIFSLSCSLLSRGADPTEEPGVEVTVDVESPEDGPEDGDGPEDDPVVEAPEDEEPSDEGEGGEELVVDTSGLEDLSSYRANITWRTEKADGTVEEFSMEQSATRDPRAEHFAMTSDGEAMEFIQIGDQTWMRFGEDWMQTTSSEDESEFGDMLSSGDDWVGGLNEDDYEFVGSDDVNGVNTRHYQAEYTQGLLGILGAGEDVDEVENGIADVWIADESDLPAFVVKYVLEVTGTSDGEEMTVTMSQEVYDINADFTIEAPEDVGGLPEDIPMYPGATDTTSMGAMTMFTVADDVNTVNEFYEGALGDSGWSKDGEGLVAEEMVSTTWTKDGETLTLMITTGEDGTSVMITMGE